MKRPTMVREQLSHDSCRIRIHSINARNGDPRGGWYRQIGAKEGMIERSLERWHDHWHQKKYETHKTRIIFDRWSGAESRIYESTRQRYIETKGLDVANEFYPEYETIEHDSVWDFFDYIGYNYKDKKVSNTDTLIFIKEKNK